MENSDLRNLVIAYEQADNICTLFEGTGDTPEIKLTVGGHSMEVGIELALAIRNDARETKDAISREIQNYLNPKRHASKEN